MEILDWSVTAANNNSAPPDGWPENMSYSSVNNVGREGMAVVRRWVGDNNGSLTSGGSSNAYTLTPNGTYTAYAVGQTFAFKANHANTGAATLNVSALGAKSILTPGGSALSSGDIPLNAIVSVTYDGTQFLLNSVLFSGLRTSSSVDHNATTNYDANKHVDHTAVSVLAGAGMSGGGTIAANRTLSVDYSGQTAIDIAGLAADDLLMVWDTSVSAFKKIKVQDIGTRVQASATQTLALDDANSLISNTGSTTHTITVPPNSSVAFPIGTEIGFFCESTGKITLAAGSGVTILSLSSHKSIKASGGGGYLVKLATNTWGLVGNLEA